ncbi:MAG: histidinol dehydrogenase [Clostridiales bacterium GWF2_36_10]|nr:MAG: histidinol dehydrogenase [Clostridiales bacterium GWF2_36_10]HAN21617.1 histidinol dehydrogenase [Clostridiales bacterium]
MIKIYNRSELSLENILDRTSADPSQIIKIEKAVDQILAEVKSRGDSALFEYTESFDKVILDNLKVTEQELDNAYQATDSEFIEILEEAVENISFFHKKQLRTGFEITEKDGIVLGQKITPLKRVGIYVPGGTASYPSTVLMNAIPARIAGVEEIVMVSPPDKNGSIPQMILAAAKIAGVNKIFKVGGAQAVASLAYGTESIPKVDKIVGPGNIYVTTAKQKVFGLVDIDMIAGPSEILVIADSTADIKCVAADLLSQAEHDKLASAVLICTCIEYAKNVSEEIERQLSDLPRNNIARESIDNNGKIIVVNNIDEAIEISNEIAPEHLEICVDNPFDYLDKIKNAGSIFLGKHTPEALGDYFAGPNHTLPTSGTARFSSPLSVDEFIKKSSYISYSKEALDKVKDKIITFAEKEGLDGHARSIEVRF